MLPMVDGAAIVDGERWVALHPARDARLQLAWPRTSRRPTSAAAAWPHSLIRREPAADDTLAREKLVPTAAALRRLVYQLDDIGLPIEPFWRHDGGLAFDLLSSYTTGEKVTIGHADGVITIDLVESLDDYRESLRVRLGEPYRTMLGHFRHEVGHYYQNVLVETGSGADGIPRRMPRAVRRRARELHRRDRPALRVRRTRGLGRVRSSPSTPRCTRGRTSPSASPTTCTSPTPSTPAARRAWCCGPTGSGSAAPRDIVPLESYDDVPIERMLFDWRWMSLFFNRVNTAMGKNPLYPFEIPPAVVAKLGFIHRVIRQRPSAEWSIEMEH